MVREEEKGHLVERVLQKDWIKLVAIILPFHGASEIFWLTWLDLSRQLANKGLQPFYVYTTNRKGISKTGLVLNKGQGVFRQQTEKLSKIMLYLYWTHAVYCFSLHPEKTSQNTIALPANAWSVPAANALPRTSYRRWTLRQPSGYLRPLLLPRQEHYCGSPAPHEDDPCRSVGTQTTRESRSRCAVPAEGAYLRILVRTWVPRCPWLWSARDLLRLTLTSRKSMCCPMSRKGRGLGHRPYCLLPPFMGDSLILCQYSFELKNLSGRRCLFIGWSGKRPRRKVSRYEKRK